MRIRHELEAATFLDVAAIQARYAACDITT